VRYDPHLKWYGHVIDPRHPEWKAEITSFDHLDPDTRPLLVTYSHDQLPLPSWVREGHIFTLHCTKRGHLYLFWPPSSLTKRKLKRVVTSSRRLAKLFDAQAEAARAMSDATSTQLSRLTS
jgi:hypothetical protein